MTKLYKSFSFNKLGAFLTSKRLLRLTSLCMIAGLTFTPITHCYYADIENGENNTFESGSLNFSLRNHESREEITQRLFDDELVFGNETTKNVTIKNEGTLSFKYTITAQTTSGNETMCNALQVGLERDGVGGIYTGDLLGMSPTIDLSGNEDNLEFRVFLNDGDTALQNKECEFELKFLARQQGISSGGFSFTKSITNNTLQTEWWVNPEVTVNSPNGGESFTIGDTVNIEWDATSTDPDATDNMKITIKLSTDDGATYSEILAADIANTGAFTWTTDKDSSHLRIKVIAKDKHNLEGSDVCDASFSSVPALEPPEPEP